jgi:hypothetical protein
MPFDSRSYEGRASEQNIPVTLVESLMNDVFNLLGEVETEANNGAKAANYGLLIQQFNNLKNRTDGIVDSDNIKVTLKTDPKDACRIVKQYLNKLQDQSIFRIGQEEVILK